MKKRSELSLGLFEPVELRKCLSIGLTSCSSGFLGNMGVIFDNLQGDHSHDGHQLARAFQKMPQALSLEY